MNMNSIYLQILENEVRNLLERPWSPVMPEFDVKSPDWTEGHDSALVLVLEKIRDLKTRKIS